MILLDTTTVAATQESVSHLTEYILGGLSSILLVAISIFISRIYKLIDTLFDRVDDHRGAAEKRATNNEEKFNALDKRVAVIETGLMKDIENLTNSFAELNTNVKELNKHIGYLMAKDKGHD